MVAAIGLMGHTSLASTRPGLTTGNVVQEEGPDQGIAYSVHRFLAPGEFEFNVATIAPDGSDTQLIDTPRPDFAPKWSPDHSRLAFASGKPRFMRLFIVDADGSNLVRVNPTGDMTPTRLENWGFDWSPDGTKIIYSQMLRTRKGSTRRAVLITDLATGDRTVVVRGRDWGHSPRWSPDGTAIVFLIPHNHRTEVYTVNTDGTNLTRLTDSARGVDNSAPHWSPDGTRLLFSRVHRDDPSDYDLWIMDADGTSKQVLASENSREYWGRWSPDGTRVAYARIGAWSSLAHIWVIDPDGGAPFKVTRRGEAGFAGFDWSPDGTEIVLPSQALAGNTFGADLFRISIETREATRVTDTPDDDEFNPDW